MNIIDKEKLKNSQGKRYLRGLFYETTLEDKSTVVYTLKDKDHKGYPSLKRLYLEEEDLSEYNFANKYLDNYEHWLMLVNSLWFKEYLESWREELRLKLEAKYLNKLKEIAEDPEISKKEAFQATKVLLDRLKKRSVGRPTKTREVEKEDWSQAKQDFERIFGGLSQKEGTSDLRMPRNSPETGSTEV